MGKILLKMSEVKGSFDVILVPYCALQRLLKFQSPLGYTVRREGWASDLYFVPWLSTFVVISTGPQPFGNIKPSYDFIKSFEKAAEKALEENDFPENEKLVNAQLFCFVDLCVKINSVGGDFS